MWKELLEVVQGRGALIASRCSPLGIGTDIGGSVRTPSAFSGITG